MGEGEEYSIEEVNLLIQILRNKVADLTFENAALQARIVQAANEAAQEKVPVDADTSSVSTMLEGV